MRPIEIPEFPILRGEKAIKALYDFINELEEERNKGLTEKQTDVLIKLAKGLISSIETEIQSDTSNKDIRETPLVTLATPPLLFSTRATSHAMLYLRGPISTVPR